MQDTEIKESELNLLKYLKTTIFKNGVTLTEIRGLLSGEIATRETWLKARGKDIATPVHFVPVITEDDPRFNASNGIQG